MPFWAVEGVSFWEFGVVGRVGFVAGFGGEVCVFLFPLLWALVGGGGWGRVLDVHQDDTNFLISRSRFRFRYHWEMKLALSS